MLGELKNRMNIEIRFPGDFYRGHFFLYPENSAVSAGLLYLEVLLVCFTASSLGVTSHKKHHCLAASFTSQSRAYRVRLYTESGMGCPITSCHNFNEYFGPAEQVTLLARPIKKLKLFPAVCRFMALG
jgi:hypothetical protein